MFIRTYQEHGRQQQHQWKQHCLLAGELLIGLGPDLAETRALLFRFVGGVVTVRVVCSEDPLPIFLSRQAVFSTQSTDDDTAADI